MRRIETNDWWPELVRRKDELSLRELAERFDVTPGAISAAFKRSGLVRKPAPPGPRHRRGKGEGESGESLPPEPGEGALASIGARPGSKDARILQYVPLLGQVPDAEVAAKANVSVRTIASFRARHGVTGYKGPRKRGADRLPRKSRIDPFKHLVGHYPDRVVAEQAGVSVNAVRNFRMRHNLSAGRRGGGHTRVDAGAHSEPTVVNGSGAWKVLAGPPTEPYVRVVVAKSLADAAVRAQNAGLGTILSLEWIGEVV